ncbi:MAG: beta-N-acetylhexosaminidase [Opitutales bacterium]
MSDPTDVLFPRPRQRTLRPGSLAVPPSKAGREWLECLPRTIAQAEAALGPSKAGPWQLGRDSSLPAEGYRLEITAEGVQLAAADGRGALYGVRVVHSLFAMAEGSLPCLEITDHPDLPVRGFMLDVSRGKVPTLPELLALVDAMGALRLNQLQLYVEHTFAWPGHEAVWRNASPLTPADLAAVGARCAELGIEFVPNLNTFGHLERWLRHEPYRRLAECPEGWTHPLTGQFKPHPSTLYPDDAALRFVAELLDGYLPHFTSGQVNIGGDEPWELGQGRSKEAVAARGKHRVYLDHLNRIHALVRARGKRMQFWGDILLEDLALAGEAPAEALPVVWGYDAGHPFDAQCGRLRELGRDYLIAPGTSTWQSFTGRLTNARANVREAVDAALRHNAAGILMTAWGDNGYHQPWPTFWLPLAEAAARAWCRETNTSPDPVLAVLPFLEDGGDAPAVAVALEAMGALDERIPIAIRNKSLSWELLCGDDAARAELGLKLPAPDVVRSLSLLEACDEQIRAIGDARVREELGVGTHLAKVALITAGQRPLTEETRRHLTERYRNAWLARARPGGLEESLSLLRLA